jgi:dTDP-4-amino-4,6-dideoxygalactose transaminase
MGKLALKGGEPYRKKPFPSWPVYGEEELRALKEVLYSGFWGIGGKKVEEFERRFASFHDAQYGIAVTNGTAALEVALRAAGIQAGDEVIVPAYTFLATASSVLYVNACPVFVDIDPETYNIDPRKVEEAITDKTKAIIPVHIGGCPADMDAIMDVARKHGLKVIEDAAQAHAAEWKGRKVGAIGDLGTFSFQSSKNITSGEGGIILTNDRNLYELAWSYHNCGRRKEEAWYRHFILGGNYRMTEFQAAILLAQLGRVEEQTKRRNENALYLSKRLSEIPGIRPLKRDPRVTSHAYHLYIFRYDAREFEGLPRERFIQALNAEGIPCSPGYTPLYRMPFFESIGRCPLSCPYHGRKIDYASLSLPVTERACNEEAVWLKQSIFLGTKEDMDDIVGAVWKIRENVEELMERKP